MTTTGQDSATAELDTGSGITASAVDGRHRYAHTLLATARTAAQATMRAMVTRLDPDLARVCAYHLGWTDTTAAGDGKALRPALAVAGAALIGVERELGARCAAVVELLHNFSLIHDDIMDHDTTRRGRPTVWARYGTPTGVLAGDALFALAIATLTEIDTPTRRGGRLVSDTMIELVRGQQQDLSFQARPWTGVDAVGVEEYVVMAGNKTGALLGCALALPAACTPTIPAAVVNALISTGRHLGVAFQAIDDILGIWGQENITGKPVCSDLTAGKKTLPVLTALAADTTEVLARTLQGSTGVEEKDQGAAARAIVDAGGRRASRGIAERETARALTCLAGTGTDQRHHTDLRAIAAFGLDRVS